MALGLSYRPSFFIEKCLVDGKHPLVMDEDLVREPLADPLMIKSFQRTQSLTRIPSETLLDEIDK
jgi:hypothetical protein